MHKVLCQRWEESEQGWGTRPDGFSLHKDQKSLLDYIEKHWSSYSTDKVPYEYSRPYGDAYWVEVTDSLYDTISKRSISFLNNAITPEPGEQFLEN